ncbi:hypothetical protein BDV35DRAFT_344514 [Aspergillus flavus]|uniref:Uncharacterized protein n=1 Tax=Aspergillus flavus TaxID=5059 RepID=A0A5N6H7U9_ASPFL|nr:hypothetical protein BDV35DRAFT_344514 [Aspergillus flavus]
MRTSHGNTHIWFFNLVLIGIGVVCFSFANEISSCLFSLPNPNLNTSHPKLNNHPPKTPLRLSRITLIPNNSGKPARMWSLYRHKDS